MLLELQILIHYGEQSCVNKLQLLVPYITYPIVEDIANHLGHNVNIHKKIYRPSTARELPTVAKILLKALGEAEEETENDNSCNCDQLQEKPCSDKSGV